MRATLPKVCLVLGLALFSAVLIPRFAGAEGPLRANLVLSSVDPTKTAKNSQQLRKASRPVKKLTDGSYDAGAPAVPYEERVFKAFLVTTFSRPPGDFEFHVLFYDVTNGSREFVDDMSINISAPDKEKVFSVPLKLHRKRFKPNRKMEAVVTVKRQEVGSLKFMTEGREMERSGVVNF